RKFVARHGLKLLALAQFVESVFFEYGYRRRGTIVGFNLPFDISRLALDHAPARRGMRGGFTFRVSDDKRRPRIQIKHHSGRLSFIQFAAVMRQPSARSQRKHGYDTPVRRGFFIDVKTLAAALTSKSWTLKGLAHHLRVPHPKLHADEHGGALTEAYI